MEPSKERLYRVLHRLGAHALVRSFYRAKGAVLMFHRVVADYPRRTFQPGAQFTVTPRVLETIIGALRASGHDLVSLDEMAERLSGPRSSRRFACLTFDDGYRDNLELAYPVCERLNAPMAVYVTTGFIGRTDPMWYYGLEQLVDQHDELQLSLDEAETTIACATLPDKQRAYDQVGYWLQRAARAPRDALLEQVRNRYGVDIAGKSAALAMDWSMLAELAAKPGVTIGAHSVTHRAMAALDEVELRREMTECRVELEQQLGQQVQHFAFPFGDPSTTGSREFALCRELGYRTATTTRHGLVTGRSDPLALPRIPTDPFDCHRTIAVKLSGLVGALQATRPHPRT